MITITEEAKQQILTAMEEHGPERKALRIEAKLGGGADLVYSMKLIADEEKDGEDSVQDAGGFEVVIDPASGKNLEGATVDYEDGLARSGFKFDNPNQSESPSLGSGERPDLTGPTAEKVQILIDSELNPAVEAHGGVISLVGVRENKVYLSFGGGCHGCGLVDVTLKQGVEARIKEVIPEIEEVVDTTDHSAGTNPFYA